MVAIVNEKSVCINYNQCQLEEYKGNGENPVMIQGHENAQKFLEALESLDGNAGAHMEELLQTIYNMGVEKGKKLQNAKKESHSPSLSLRR